MCQNAVFASVILLSPAGDISSGVAVLEAASREYESTIGMRSPVLVSLNKRAYSLFQTLPGDERSKVLRRSTP